MEYWLRTVLDERSGERAMGELSAEDRPLDGKDWKEYVRFAHEIATLKLQVEGRVERMIYREAFYRRLETPAEQRA